MMKKAEFDEAVEERVGIMIYSAGMSEAEAKERAVRVTLAEWERRSYCSGTSSPGASSGPIGAAGSGNRPFSR